MKLLRLTVISTIIIFAMNACQQAGKSTSENNNSTEITTNNNWSEDQKKVIFMMSKSTALAKNNSNINNNAEEIAQKTLDACMKIYPQYEDFNSAMATDRMVWVNIFEEVKNKYE